MSTTISSMLQITTSGDLTSQIGSPAPVSATPAGTLVASEVINVGTSAHVLLPPTEIATPGLCIIKYMGTTNYVQIGTDTSNDGLGTFVPVFRIYGNAPFVQQITLDGTNKLFAKCNTAAADVFVQVFQR